MEEFYTIVPLREDFTWFPRLSSFSEDDGEDNVSLYVTQISTSTYRVEVGSWFSPFGICRLEVTASVDQAIRMMIAVVREAA